MGWIEDLTDAVETHRNERIAANTSAEALWAQGTSGFSGEETDCNRSAGKLAALSDQPRGKVGEKSWKKVAGFQRRTADLANTPTQATNIAAAINVASAEGTCMAIIA